MNLKQQFRNAVRHGTGEAYILLKENPAVDFSGDIVKASMFNFAYDRQSEGNRSDYLAGLIDLSFKKSKILKVIYETLIIGEGDLTFGSLWGIATIFAKRGDCLARQVIYEDFQHHLSECPDWCGRDSIVEIDGFEGLKYVAEKVGKSLSENPDREDDSWFVDSFQEDNPEIDVYGELRKEAVHNSDIEKYLHNIEKNKFSRSKHRSTKADYNYVKDKIDNTKLGIIPPRISQMLSKRDLKKLADEFLAEKSRARQEKYLRIFADVRFPYGHEPILHLAKGKNSRKARLVRFAVEALKFFTAEDIRQFAVEKLSVTNDPAAYTDLLIGNYRKGDWKLLKSIAEKYKNEEIIHSLGSSYIDIYEANPTEECLEPLEVIYNKMNCGLHRFDLVNILIENNVLPEKIRNEIQFDSEERTRNLLKPSDD